MRDITVTVYLWECVIRNAVGFPCLPMASVQEEAIQYTRLRVIHLVLPSEGQVLMVHGCPGGHPTPELEVERLLQRGKLLESQWHLGRPLPNRPTRTLSSTRKVFMSSHPTNGIQKGARTPCIWLYALIWYHMALCLWETAF